MGCADPPRKGVGAPHEITKNEVVGGGSSLARQSGTACCIDRTSFPPVVLFQACTLPFDMNDV